MRKGRNAAQASLNKALDDLLGPDEDDIERPPSRSKNTNQQHLSPKKGTSKTIPRKGGLTSSASNKDFYKNLSAIAGKDIELNDDEEEENYQVSATDAAQVASSLANMDDLESDLFGSFGGKKSSTGPKLSKPTKKVHDIPDFDEDDPLAGLGLSDDDDILSKKPKPKKHDPLSRKFSHTSSKGKVDPNLNDSTESPRSEKPLIKSTSFEKDDPFLATDPRPRSGSIDRKIKRLNSWDEPSLGTQSASESELTPRSRSNSGSNIKHERKGSNRRKKVNPSPPKSENAVNKSEDSIDTPMKEKKFEKAAESNKSLDNRKESKTKKQNKAKESEDMFADDDDLPGLSDDEVSRPKAKVAAKRVEEDEPVRKASAALSDLLGNNSKPSAVKSRKPTFLEQMMSKSANKNDGPSPMETDSPIVSPREKDIMFGGYSPSVGGNKDRPTTAPNKRSVRFADELGFDDLGSSFSESRPVSAPESGRSRKNAGRLKSSDQSFSFDDDATDVSLEIKDSEVKRSPVKKAAAKPESAKVKEDDKPKSPRNGNAGDQRRSLQRSRRSQASFDKSDDKDNRNDWLGLGDDDDFPEPIQNKATASKSNLSSSVNNEKKNAESALTPRNDDWLGLGNERKDEMVKKTGQNDGLNTQIDKIEEQVHNAPKTTEKSSNDAKSPSTKVANDDSLFPWELSTPLTTRERRRQRSRQFDDTLHEAIDDTFGESKNRNPSRREQPSKEPLTHSTPKDAEEFEIRTDVKTPTLQRNARDTENAIVRQQTKDEPFIRDPTNPPTQQASQPPITAPNFISQNAQSTPQGLNVSAAVGDSFAAQVMAAQRILSMMPNQAAFNNGVISQLGPNPVPVSNSLNVEETSQLQNQIEKITAEKLLQQKKLEELGVEKTHNEQQRQALESEMHNLQAKVNALEEGKVKLNVDNSKKIKELESKVRKYELEVEQWKATQDLTQKRHEEEVKAMENSYKTRFKILGDTYERRETQLKEEHEYSLKIANEKLKAAENEKQEIISFNKKKIEMVEKNKDSDIERIKEIHKKVIEDTKKDYEDQIERLRLLKEQEVAAATSMFSQTKSLQSLIQQVHNSASEVDQLQKRVDSSHKTGLSEREFSLKARDEYLKSMQERLHQQETENIEERSRLQSLIAKLEIQLRQQSRQQDQDKWKITQDENRIKSMQAAFEAERRSTLEQLNREREMVDMTREELTNDQKRIMSECYEERQRINAERSRLESAKMKYNKNNLDKEYASLKERETKITAEEQRLYRERKNLEQSFDTINMEKDKLEEFAKKIQEKSKQIEELSQEARKVQQEGIEALEYSESMKVEVSHMSSILERRALSVQEKENALLEEKASLEVQQRNFEREKEISKCMNCKRPISAQFGVPDLPAQNLESRSQYSSANSTISSVSQNTSSETAHASETRNKKKMIDRKSQQQQQTPDLLINSLDFNRKLRKWSSDREQDEQFFEEESKYLNNIQQKRERSLKKR